MEIHEIKPGISVRGIVAALLWLAMLVPIAVFFFGIFGLIAAIALAIVARAMKPKKFIVISPTAHQHTGKIS